MYLVFRYSRMPEFIHEAADILRCDLNSSSSSSVKNKFRIEWLTEKDSNGTFLSDYIRKIREPGYAWCIICNDKLNYGSKGKSSLIKHGKSASHLRKIASVKSMQSLPAAFQTHKSLTDGTGVSPLPYGVAENVKASVAASGPVSASDAPPPPRPPSLADRVAHQEATICSYLSEYSLPLSHAPHLIALAKTLAQDPQALSKLSMERHTATYKLKHGLYELQRKRLVSTLSNTCFSINVDESTTKHSRKRVLNVIVCYFCPEISESVSELYCSLEMTTVNAQTVFDAIMKKFNEDEIPLTNLFTILSDSAAYMRGQHSGFQKRMKDVAPHLANIDGDVCHHMHNIVKLFSTSLDDDNLRQLLDDLHKDFSFSADLRDDLFSVCHLLGLKELIPKERVGHRWLSIYDCTVRLQEIVPALTVFYFAWVPRNDKDVFSLDISTILKERKVSPAARQKIFTILRRLKSKNLTQLGTARKLRIVRRLFDDRVNTDLVAEIITSILPMFKSFVLTFEQKTPMIHKLHDQMVKVFQDFLGCFIRAEYLPLSGKKLVKLDVSNTQYHIPLPYVYGGNIDSKLKRLTHDQQKAFRNRLLSAYIKTAVYMQGKLPICNPVLRTLSLLDPTAHGQTDTAIMLRKLPTHFPAVLSESEVEPFYKELTDLMRETNLPEATGCKLDHWWAAVFKLRKYSLIEKMVRACLSIFSGPRVEQSFSMMNNIISQQGSSMNISTYEAIQGVKYSLLKLKTTSCQLFSRPDKINSPVDKALAFHMQTARRRHYSRLHNKKEQKAAVSVPVESGSSNTVMKAGPHNPHLAAKKTSENIGHNAKRSIKDFFTPAPKRQKN